MTDNITELLQQLIDLRNGGNTEAADALAEIRAAIQARLEALQRAQKPR